MSTQPLEQHTYLPERDDRAAEVLSFMRAQAARGLRTEPRYFLAGADEHDHVEIPASVHGVLLQVLEALAAGKAVTVAPQNTLMTTQEAAELLGVSRPTVVKLIDDGVLPGETPGRRRRMVKLDDVLEYRERRREARYRALMADELDYDAAPSPPETDEEDYRRVRAAVAARRRSEAGD